MSVQDLGASSHCLVADCEENHFKIFTNSLTLQKGEAVLVCSDGLHDALAHNRLRIMECLPFIV